MTRFLRPVGVDLDGRATDPAYAPAWTRVQAAASASLASPLRGADVTDRPSGWGHNYYCPAHGSALEFVETEPDRHRCPDFDHEVAGEQFDTGWAYARNIALMAHLSASALAAAVTGAPEHATRAIGVLTELAEVYPDLPLHGTKVGQGRLMHQSLEEAVAATTLARSHDLVEPWMEPAQRELVADGLFRPMAGVIEDHLMHRTHNIEVWHLAGLSSLAVVLDEPELARTSQDREHGLRAQLADGVRADGWWYEGSPGYHFYMLTAVLAAAEAQQALGIESDATGWLERMLLTPVRTARNDLTVPSFNDSHLATAIPPGLAVHSDLYLRGAALCRSSELDAFLASEPAAGFDRSTAGFLVYGRPRAVSEGAPADAGAGWPVERTDVLPDSGYAVLRQPAAQTGHGPDTCVFVKFGPHGGGHGHPDKLHIELVVDGARAVADPGTTVYTNPMHRPWYVQTWAHSTVLVDRISQPPISGRLLGHRQVGEDLFGCVDAEVVFGEEPDPEGVQVLWHQEDPSRVAAYTGVTMRRTLVMVPPSQGDYLLDLVRVDLPVRRSVDLITHVRGRFAAPPTGRPATDRMLLPQFAGVRRAERASGWTDYLLADDDRPWSRHHTGAHELLTATTPSNPTHESCATTVERVVGRQAWFVSAVPLGRTSLHDLRTSPDGTVELDVDGVIHRWAPSQGYRAPGPGTDWTEPPLGLHLTR